MQVYRIDAPERSILPIIAVSAHSGRFYPDEFLKQCQIPLDQLRKLEDCYVDELAAFCPQLGIAFISLNYARAYIDVNRDAMELDPEMFKSPLPIMPNDTSRIKMGLGSIPRLVESREIYSEKIAFVDILRRIDNVYRPFHRTLRNLIDSRINVFGRCLVIDCHSMPDLAAPLIENKDISHDIILGNRFGETCHDATIGYIEQAFQNNGFSVKRNDPFAGGFITRNYGKPKRSVETIQIEINRKLYLDEKNFTKNSAFNETQKRLQSSFQIIASLHTETTAPMPMAAE